MKLPIVVWGTTLLTARKRGEKAVHVSSVRSKLDVSTLPFEHQAHGLRLCTELFGDRFVERDGLLAIALSNLNPQNHLGIALLNFTRMEKGETWSQAGNVTPAVGGLIEALDRERLAIAEYFGIAVRTVREHFSLSFHVPMGSVTQMNAEMDRQGRGGLGPTTTDSRYVLEDVPFGLYPTILLGSVTGRKALLHASGVEILSAAYGRDLTLDNDILPILGLHDMGPEAIASLCRSGF